MKCFCFRVEKKNHAEFAVAVKAHIIQIIAVQRRARSRHLAPVQTARRITRKFNGGIFRQIAEQKQNRRTKRLKKEKVREN